MKRRNFLKKVGTTSLAAIVGGTSALSASTQWKRISPLEKLNVGVIGCNGMGWANTSSLLKMKDVNLLGICDVDSNAIARRMEDIQKINNGSRKPKTYGDYRRLLNNKDIDIVVIGTPDHWHCLQYCDALQAGKHVYVEKPIANTIQECNLMVKAQQRSKKMVQVGQWQRSGPHYRKAIDIVQSGDLGRIRLVKVWAYQGWMPPVPIKPDGIVPAGVDYKSWLGPAPTRPFNENRFHFNFRWFWDYAGGLMTDWGVHEIDIALHAMQATTPKSVTASGGKFAYPDDASETPDTLQTIFEFEDFSMLWEHATGIDLGPYQKPEGIAFIGNNGTLVVNRDGYEIIAEREPAGYGAWGKSKMEVLEKYSLKEDKDVPNYLDLHTMNFVESIKSENETILNTHIASGSLAAINAQMGNISYKTGGKVKWNSAAGNFGDDRAANALMNAQYKNGYSLPRF